MTLLKIATVGHPVLREPTHEIGVEELRSEEMQRFIDDMIETMRDANGAGIAANQVHRSLRIAVIEVGRNPRYPYKPPISLRVLVNPRIEVLDDEVFENNEGCLSVPGIRGNVYRHVHIRVSYLDRDGEPVVEEQKGLSAGTFQHELDHLDGKLFLDRVTDPTTLTTWEHFERFHRAPFIERVTALVERFGS